MIHKKASVLCIIFIAAMLMFIIYHDRTVGEKKQMKNLSLASSVCVFVCVCWI